jgi:hypothetical protein
MEQISYQGYAQAEGFNPIQVSQESVNRIARDGQRTIRGMQQAAEQDIRNRERYLESLQSANRIEEQTRQTAYESKTRSRQARQEALKLNDERARSNAVIKGENQVNTFKSLSSLSMTAAKLAGTVEREMFERQADDEYQKTLMDVYENGLPAKTQIAHAANEHALRIAGEAIEIKADQLAAAGADPAAVNAARGLNRARRYGRDKALAEVAGQSFKSEALKFLETNEDLVITIPGDTPGTTREIRPIEAATSAEKAAVLTAFIPEYLKQKGLYGRKTEFLSATLVKMRTGVEEIVAGARAEEAKVADQNRLNEATEAAAAARSVESLHDLYRTVTRSTNPQTGRNYTPREAREYVFSMLATQVNEDGQLMFSDTERQAFYDSAFFDQPNNPIGKRFATEIADAKRQARNAEMKYFDEIDASRDLENKQVLRDLKDNWLKSWDGNEEELNGLIEAATGAGNFEAVRWLSNFASATNEAKNDREWEKIWAGNLALGVLTTAEIQNAVGVSTETKLKWLPKARESESTAMPEETAKAYRQSIDLALRKQSQQMNLQQAADRTLPLAQLHAWRQFQADYRQAIINTNGNQREALEYANGRFEKELQKPGGLYSIVERQIVNGKPVLGSGFRGFQVAPQAAKPFAMTHTIDVLKQNPGAIDTEPLIEKGVLERVSQRARNGQGISIPPQVQYISDRFGGRLSPLDIINRQAKLQGVEQIPNQAYERTVSTRVSPEYMRLLNYFTNKKRYQIATVGSGSAPGYAPSTIRRGSAAYVDISQTLLAAGFEAKDVPLFTAIAMAESSGNPKSMRRDTDVHGLWQIRYPVHQQKLKALGINSREDLYNPLNNARAAYAIFKSQGLGAWSAYTNGAYQQYLGAAQAASRSYGQGPWRQGSNMNPRLLEYLTGDPSHSGYRADHGGSNYHEHLAFKTPEEARAAAAKLNAAGIKTTELKGVNPVGRHSERSYHYSGQAFDVPASQVPIGKEQELSMRVRRILGIS